MPHVERVCVGKDAISRARSTAALLGGAVSADGEVHLPPQAISRFVSLLNARAEHHCAAALPTLIRRLPAHIIANAELGLPMLDVTNLRASASLVICAAGPSLRESAPAYVTDRADVWACNSAAAWLRDAGLSFNRVFAIDAAPRLLPEIAPCNAGYLMSTAVDPEVLRSLVGWGADVQLFHDPTAAPDVLWPLLVHFFSDNQPCIRGGPTVLGRAVALGVAAGYESITLLGADCAYGVRDELHANGDGFGAHVFEAITLEGTLGGRVWRTSPELLRSARWLARETQKRPNLLHVVGDSLINALLESGSEAIEDMVRAVAA